MVLHRKDGSSLVYHFKQSTSDFIGQLLSDTVICLDLYELKDETPCLLLMCAEVQRLSRKSTGWTDSS